MAYTIKDVARRAGVSYQTVSRAVNHPEHVSTAVLDRIRTVMAELSWEPNAAARALRLQGRSDTSRTAD